MNNKYIKYKNKYLQLKYLLEGGSDTHAVGDSCVVCPTKDDVILQLETIKRQLPDGCINYGFIELDLHQRILSEYNSEKNIYFLNELSNRALNEEYCEFLNTNLFNGIYRTDQIGTQIREIIIDYKNMSTNASTEWHQDGEYISSTLYNILYYLKIENCRHDCGTEIAFKKLDSEIVIIKLPIMEGLIIALKDDCFSHKSPVISLIDTEQTGSRTIVRSYIRLPDSDEIIERNNITIRELSEELNTKKLEDCLKKYFNSESESIKLDCLDVIKRAWNHGINKNPLIDPYYDDNKSFFDNLSIR
jgi:hypothetical protein